MSASETTPPRENFLEAILRADQEAGTHAGWVHTRFPPEPNGYPHIGHAKSICINFGLAEKFGGQCNLRFDDTNPTRESTEFVEAIKEDVRWLGFDWEDRLYFTSDYFGKLYELAEELVHKGVAYVCDLSLEDTRAQRGGPNEPGTASPFRDRSAEENLDLLRRMRKGEFEEGTRTLRAKIDMAHKNLLMRDPVLYRILKTPHHRTGTEWSIYPTYDWAHGQSDALEGITHSICTLEFENHRPLYDWFLDQLVLPNRPRQYEMARLNVSYTVVGKRHLSKLIEAGHVSGWDDPRMPTLRGMRRRGYTPEAVRHFCEDIGVTRVNGIIDMVRVENALREDLNKRAERRMAVLRPLKVVIENLAEGEALDLTAVNNPEDESAGTRQLQLTREIHIERDDFREDAPRKFFRLAPGKEVRLRYAFCITCTEVIHDEAGEVVELRCTYDPETGNGQTPDGRKVKGVLHWVAAPTAVDAEVRLYDHLFAVPNPLDLEEGQELSDHLNPSSLEVVRAKLEPSLAETEIGKPVQFERLGYFCPDTDSTPEALVFNRSVSLRDSWAKLAKKG